MTQRITRDQMAAYGLQGQRSSDYELDHLVSLDLGGASEAAANLWPEPWNGDSNAPSKDALENYPHDGSGVGWRSSPMLCEPARQTG